ncbi:UNVERIFIED_CONTAM: hypothetical protein Sangu_3115200 [Sesamum angustifolium]|uniref:Uncharacterized protein n=1 Tax=Sesamum angustifolium TaxID=2727405 RepID=A0AAW2K5R0_9LAMI
MGPHLTSVKHWKDGMLATANFEASYWLQCLNDIQKQYDRLDDVTSILQHMKEVNAILYRHTRYVATKDFFRAMMIEGSSMQEHGVEMLSLVEKLDDLKAGLDNDIH